MMGHLQQTFREWVRGGMSEPAPSFEELRDDSMYLPADVIEMLVAERGLTDFWTYGQAVRQLTGEPSDRDLLAIQVGLGKLGATP